MRYGLGLGGPRPSNGPPRLGMGKVHDSLQAITGTVAASVIEWSVVLFEASGRRPDQTGIRLSTLQAIGR